MAETSGIAWTRSTFNPWMGCTKVGPGCDNCYASVSTPVRTMEIGWGAGQPRKRTSIANWVKVNHWNKLAPSSEFAGRKGFWPVFTASLADVWDNEVPIEWLIDYLELVRRCPNLTFLIVTKRIGNVMKRLREAFECLKGRPGATFGDPLIKMLADWLAGLPPPHVWLIVTVVNQTEANRDIIKLLRTPARVRGLSIEPQLGPIELWRLSALDFEEDAEGAEVYPLRGLYAVPDCDWKGPKLDWVICGGESKQGGAAAREFQQEWAEELSRQTREAGVAFFMKQLGHNATVGVLGTRVSVSATGKGADPAEWPTLIRRQEFPEVNA